MMRQFIRILDPMPILQLVITFTSEQEISYAVFILAKISEEAKKSYGAIPYGNSLPPKGDFAKKDIAFTEIVFKTVKDAEEFGNNILGFF